MSEKMLDRKFSQRLYNQEENTLTITRKQATGKVKESIKLTFINDDEADQISRIIERIKEEESKNSNKKPISFLDRIFKGFKSSLSS